MPSPTTGTTAVNTTLTGYAFVDSLLDGYHWYSSAISYSFIFPGTSYYSSNYPDLSFWQSTQGFNLTQQTAAFQALSAWSDVANLQFANSPDNSTTVGTIRFGFSYSHVWGNSVGGTYTPNSLPSGGDVWLDPTGTDSMYDTSIGEFGYSSFLLGSYAYNTLIHEIGHALGLKHPFDSSSDGGGASIDGTQYQFWDSRILTVMAYSVDQSHTDAMGFTFNPTTPMLLDILAIQSIYGANYSYNSGNTTYSFNDNPGQHYFQTIWDGGGNNTISYSGNTSSSIDLRPGYGSYVGNPVYAYTATNPTAYNVKNLWIAYGTHIDTATTTGTGNNTLTANNDGDTLIGGAGNDTLIGGTGNDTFSGGGGNNTITGGGGVDTAEFSNALSTYTIIPSTSVTDATGTTTLNQIDYLKFSDKTIYNGPALTNASGSLTNAANIDALYIAFTGDAAGNSVYGTNLNYTDPVALAKQFTTSAGLTNNASGLPTVFKNLGLTTQNDSGPANDVANNQAGLYSVMAILIQNDLGVVAAGGLAYATNWLVNALASISTTTNPTNYAAYSVAAAALDTNIINAHNYSSQAANLIPEAIGTVSAGITGVLTQPLDQVV